MTTTIQRPRRQPSAWGQWADPAAVIRSTVATTATWKEAADALGVTTQTLRVWRQNFPDVFK